MLQKLFSSVIISGLMSFNSKSEGSLWLPPSIDGDTSGVHIAAGGHGTRLRRVMDAMHLGPDYPKHLLPTGNPDGETLLGRIVRQAAEAPVDGPVIIHANEQNFRAFEHHPDVSSEARVVAGDYQGSLEPFTANMLGKRQRTLGSAGDFYADFSWREMLDAHESNRFPVTFMVGRTVAVEGGAVFDVDDTGRINALRRTLRTDEADIINIGAYIFEPHETVIRALDNLYRSSRGERISEETVANELIARRLVGAYMIKGAFNVNTPETYAALLNHAAEGSDEEGLKTAEQAG